MKGKNLEITLLMDFYGEILTEKQKEVLMLYYEEDLSLAEIAEQAKISRQGVRDCIKRGEATLLFMEERLGLAKKFDAMKSAMSRIDDAADRIDRINTRYCFSKEIGALAQTIHSEVQTLLEDD